MRRIGIASAYVVATLGLAPSSRADATHPRVSLSLDSCPSTDPAEVRRILSLELDARLAPAEEPDTTLVRAACRGSVVLVEVKDPITGKSLARAVDLATALPRARPRLLALALVELVWASWTELESNPQPAVPPASTPPSEDARAAALHAVQARADRTADAPRAEATPTQNHASDASAPAAQPAKREDAGSSSATANAQTWLAEGFVRGRDLLASGLMSIGFGAAVAHRAWEGGGWRFDLAVDHAGRDTSLGSVSLETASVGPSAFIERLWGPVTVDAGVGFRLGLAALSGRPQTPNLGNSLVSPWGGPVANLRGRLEIARRLALELGGELGDAPFPVRGIVVGGRDLSFVGAWLDLHAGACVLFP